MRLQSWLLRSDRIVRDFKLKYTYIVKSKIYPNIYLAYKFFKTKKIFN